MCSIHTSRISFLIFWGPLLTILIKYEAKDPANLQLGAVAEQLFYRYLEGPVPTAILRAWVPLHLMSIPLAILLVWYFLKEPNYLLNER